MVFKEGAGHLRMPEGLGPEARGGGPAARQDLDRLPPPAGCRSGDVAGTWAGWRRATVEKLLARLTPEKSVHEVDRLRGIKLLGVEYVAERKAVLGHQPNEIREYAAARVPPDH